MSDSNNTAPPVYDGDSTGGSRLWGAKDSLRRTLHPDADDEVESAPLLGDDPGSVDDDGDDEGNGSIQDVEWEGMADFIGVLWWRRPSVLWLVPTFFLYALAFGGILIPKINLIISLICREYYTEKSKTTMFSSTPFGDDDDMCHSNADIQVIVTKFTLTITIIVGTLSAVMSPKLGALSDRYGRIKVLCVSSCGSFMTEVITVLAASFPETVHYKWLLAGAVFEGICGSFTAGFAITHAYAADCTPPPKRAVAFGYFHACLFSGIALGPLAVAFIIENEYGTLLTIFYIALGIHAFFILFVLLVVPESLSKKRQNLAQEKHAAERARISADGYTWLWAYKTANILEPLKILWPTGPGTSNRLRSNLILLSAVDTTIFGVAMGAINVVVLYSGYRFHWKTAETSKFVSVVNIFRVSGLIIILPLLNYLVRTRRANRQARESGLAKPEPNSGSDLLDLSIVRGAILLEVLGYSGYATATTSQMFVGAGILAALGGVGSPTLQSALTKHVPHENVGQLLGATGLLHAIARVIAPTIFGLIYARTVADMPSAVFVVLAASFGTAFLASWFIRPHVYLESPQATTANTERSNVMNDPDVLIDEEIGGT
ncbi:major facilitator superfamily domain-containing protein [Amylocarpus encephaloides]|uniref:Major facilitator superfamily domain-containing protein n=1 Tax=Amylocarpus encephaloides TaxID=45428 RepID=A0A9P7YQN8_9HELO|nr:major facilitator superfamily domain-containing protein [Amylocarpus encephaloides]